MNPREVAILLQGLSGFYPNFQVDANRIAVWAEWLSDVERGAAEQAVRGYCIEHPNFAPTPGHILNALGFAPETQASRALDAWDRTMRWIDDLDARLYPSQKTLYASDPNLERAAKSLGGLEAIAYAKKHSAERAGIMRAQFLKCYGVMSVEADRVEHHPPELKGPDILRVEGGA